MMYDFVVVGSGIAGLYTALLAGRGAKVLLLAKSSLDDTNTNHAQGGIAAAVGPGDSAEQHWRDTMLAGDGLCDPLVGWVVARDAKDRIAELMSLGVPFDTEGGRPALAREGAHSAARVLHAGGDATGARIQEALACLVRQSANIDVREQHDVVEIVVESGRARGVIAHGKADGAQMVLSGRHVVLATGGAGRVFERTTNPPVATGSGIALAYRAGAEVADLEFCQFHPTALALPGAPAFLISEAARGEGAMLRNADGARFMFDYDPMGELAARHIVASAIQTEMERCDSDHVLLDLTHLPADRVLGRFPAIAAFCRTFGLDITRQAIPVAPAAHYMMGGVRTDLWGRTSVEGLLACGEVACTGLHGANRLASNSLLEGLVFAERIVRGVTKGADEHAGAEGNIAEEMGAAPIADCREGAVDVVNTMAGITRRPVGLPTLTDVQKLMWRDAGMQRSAYSLHGAAATLDRWAVAAGSSGSARSSGLSNLLLVSRLMVRAALDREETRGAHRRVDFPAHSARWRRRLVYRSLEAARPQVAGAMRR